MQVLDDKFVQRLGATQHIFLPSIHISIGIGISWFIHHSFE